jgi:hypothetical protein
MFTTAEAPDPAGNPQPPDGTIGVTLDADLSWAAGARAVAHDVYFGTDPAGLPLVSEAQAAAAYDPGLLNPATTYYWSVAEIGPGGVTQGALWSFSTVTLPWTDGFESGTLEAGGWISDGQVAVVDDTYAGAFAVRTNRPAWLEKAINTAGYGSVTFTFACKTFGMDSGEYLYLEWSPDGAVWHELDRTGSDVSDWTLKTVPCPGGGDTPGFRFRFRSDADKNREYGFVDAVRVDGTPLGPDETPPAPDPMTWAQAPTALDQNTVSMTATTASDPSGVEYFFSCTTHAGHDSGWQDAPTYTDTGLDPDTTYTYTVTARDKSANLNETAPSAPASATTPPLDTTPPAPDPMTWATAPYATSATSVTMAATAASDPSGVEYYFSCVSGDGHDSGWQGSPTYTDTGLTPDTVYTYTVTARDLSAALNETGPSDPAAAATPPLGSNTVYVHAVTLGWKQTGRNYRVTADVEIRTTAGGPAVGAQVTGAWSGTQSGTSSEITDDAGLATLGLKVTGAGTYYFAVTDVMLDGYVYDPGLNNTAQIETEVTIP